MLIPMRRREYLATAVALPCITTVAGCLGGIDLTDPPGEFQAPDYLQVTDQDLTTESGASTDRITFSINIENTESTRVAYLRIRPTLVDGTGLQMGGVVGERMRLDPGGVWEFEENLRVESTSGMDSYQIRFMESFLVKPDKVLASQPKGEDITKFDGLHQTASAFRRGKIEFESVEGLGRVSYSSAEYDFEISRNGTEVLPIDVAQEHQDSLRPVNGEEAYNGAAYVVGNIENVGERKIGATTRVRSYAGNLLGESTTQNDALAPGDSWEFEVHLEGDARQIEEYDIAVVSA